MLLTTDPLSTRFCFADDWIKLGFDVRELALFFRSLVRRSRLYGNAVERSASSWPSLVARGSGAHHPSTTARRIAMCTIAQTRLRKGIWPHRNWLCGGRARSSLVRPVIW